MAKKTAAPDLNARLGAKRELVVKAADAETAKRNLAKAITTPALAATRVIQATEGGVGIGAKLDTMALVGCLKERAAAMQGGNLAHAEAMLINQATALQSLFARLVERGMMQDHMPNLEGFLRLALRAQAQCTRTLETLAAIKNPPVVFAKQANIAQQQQVNNHAPAVPTRAREVENAPSKLLETLPGERLEFGTAATASGVDSHLEAVGAVNRAEVGNR